MSHSLPVRQLGQLTPNQGEDKEMLWRTNTTPKKFIKAVESDERFMQSKLKKKWSKKFDDEGVMVVVYNGAAQAASGLEYHVQYYVIDRLAVWCIVCDVKNKTRDILM